MEAKNNDVHSEDNGVWYASGKDSYRWGIRPPREWLHQWRERERPSFPYLLSFPCTLYVVIGQAMAFVIMEGEAALSNAVERMNRNRTNRKQMAKQTYKDCFEMHADLTRGRSEDDYRKRDTVCIQLQK